MIHVIQAYEAIQYYQFQEAYQLFYQLTLAAFVELMEINVHLTFVFVLAALHSQEQRVLMVLVRRLQLNLEIHLDSKTCQTLFLFNLITAFD